MASRARTKKDNMKRKLTGKEIEELVSFIEPNQHIPAPTADSLTTVSRSLLISQLDQIEIYPKMIPLLAEEIKKSYLETLVQAGECVGVITAQCIGERQTQSNLNLFHKAGSADKQPIVSKFAELLNATNKPKAPSYFIYFQNGNKTVKELRETMGYDIVQITIKQLVKDLQICIKKKPESWYKAFFIMKEENYDQWAEKWTDCVSIKIDMNILYEYKLKLEEIADDIMFKYSDIYCVYSPDCFGRLDVYVDTSNIELPEKILVYINEDNMKDIYLEEVVQPMLESNIVCGISGIVDRFFVKDNKTEEWFVETQNSREKPMKMAFRNSKEKPLDSVRRFKTVLSHPRVNMIRTTSNNVWDILHTFGIEAARQYMINEFSIIMEGINTCHVMLLVDKMTYNGSIASISRYTMRRDDSGVLSRASFEETLDNLLNAGVFGQDEPTQGVSASIICGKIAQIGTGMCDLSVNLDKLGVIEEEDKKSVDSDSEDEAL